jgi:hypothetical protein
MEIRSRAKHVASSETQTEDSDWTRDKTIIKNKWERSLKGE